MIELSGICIFTYRSDHASANVTTTAYTEITSALSDNAKFITINDISGEAFFIAFGVAGAEANQIRVPRGGIPGMIFQMQEGIRISMKAITGNMTGGDIIINVFR